MPITPETMAVIRQVADTVIDDSLKTSVTVLRRTRSSENAYGTSGETWSDGETYLGWLVSVGATDINKLGGMAGGTNEFELRLPLEAVIDPGDRVLIGGETFTVQNTNNEDTLPVFMEATLRRIE